MRAMVEGAGARRQRHHREQARQRRPYPVAAIERIDTLVSDAPDEELQVYRDLGIEVRARMSGTPKQARAAVTAIFFLNGLIFGEWAARIPAVRDRVGLSDGELGIVLACAADRLDRRHADRRRARRAHRQPPRHARRLRAHVPGQRHHRPRADPLVLCALALFYGASMGSLDVTMNAHGVAVEKRYDRAILASFHAAFSIGGLAGGVIGALAAAADVDVRVQLAVVAAIAAAIGLTWSRRFLGADEDAVGRVEPVFVRPPRRLLAWARWPSPACSSRARRPTGARSTCATTSGRPPASPPSASPPSA